MTVTNRSKEPAAKGVEVTVLRGWPFIVPCAALALFILASGLYFANRSGKDPLVYSNDFNVFYHAATQIVSGHNPYQSSLSEWTPYLYPPFLAVALTPLAVLPLPVAAYAWFLINAISICAAAWMSAKLTSADTGIGRTVSSDMLYPVIAAACLLIVARFVLDNFDLGQVNPLLAALVAAHVFLYTKNRRLASALVLVIAASIKLTPLIVIAYHVARGRLKFGIICVALFVGVTAMSFLPLGRNAFDGARIAVNRAIRNEQGFDLSYSGNQSLRGVVARAIAAGGDANSSASSNSPSDLITLIASLLLLGGGLIAANRAASEVVAAANVACCMVVLSPLAWKAHFVALILPIACLIAHAVEGGQRRRVLIGSALFVAFALFNLTSPRVIGLPAAEWADAHSLVFSAALVIFIVNAVISVTGTVGKQARVC